MQPGTDTRHTHKVPGPEHFEIRSEPAPQEAPEGGILIQVLVLSADPYLRGGCKTKNKGEEMSGFIAGKVIESHMDGWVKDDYIGGSFPFTNVLALTAGDMGKTVTWKLTGMVDDETITRGVGVLGMPGSTAYGGLIDVLKVQEGQTIWVSAGAGAVGGMVGMLAKNVYNCTVLGSAGGPDKCKLMKESFGFDHAIDYKQAGDADALYGMVKDAAPDGIDMYFENVGGIHFDAAFKSLRKHGRIAVCGAISQYNDAVRNPNSIDIANMIYNFQRIEGFMCMPWLSGAQGNFLQDMSKWVSEGKVHVEETPFYGIEEWPTAFQALFTGANTGKVVVRL